MLTAFSLAVALALVSDRHISGRVVDAKDSMPIPGVTVCIEGSGRCVSSDQTGAFLFSQLPAEDRVTLTVEMPAVGRSSYSMCVAPRGTTEVVIPLPFDSGVIDCTYWGDPASMRYRVSGVVLDHRDAPLSGVALEIRDSEGVTHWKGRSARNGSFDVDDLPNGRFTLHLSKRGYLAQAVAFHVQYCAPEASLRPRLGPRCK